VVNVATQVAWPPERTWLPPLHVMVFPPSLKATVPPLGEGLPVTVAVNVTELPVKDGSLLALSEVVVPVWVWSRVKIRLQPLID
jgi:hypothetical protein